MSGCTSCSTGQGVTLGCKGGGGCASGGCNKLNVFDWLSDMEDAGTRNFDVIEVRFKNGRKEFYRNSAGLDLTAGDPVVVDVPNGHHLGYVSLQGELVRLQMKKKKVPNDGEVRGIYRIASDKDLEKYEMVSTKEMGTMFRTREIIAELGLNMKLTDVEYQADNTKATFYYSADDRVDFRELIKVLASEFKIRVEMRQISLRQEAGRLGGIGSCGRELCCSTWLSEFKSVSTSAARYQNLSLNPSKLSGQCGRLKCCLNYELETYMDALEGIPQVSKPLQTEKGDARLQKTDIFRKIMWFGFGDDNTWYPISTDRVKEIQALNERGEKPATLTEDELILPTLDSINSDLESLDQRLRKRAQKQKNKKRKNRRRNQDGDDSQEAVPQAKQGGGGAPKAEGGGAAKEGRRKPNRNRRRNTPKGEGKSPQQGGGQPNTGSKPQGSAPKKDGSGANKGGEGRSRRKRGGRRGGGNKQEPKNDA